MGVTIHYSGQINSIDDIPSLKAELSDIAESLSWEYHVKEREPISLESSVDIKEYIFNNMDGISINPPNCESVSFYFLPNRKLVPVVIFAYPNDEIPEILNSPKTKLFTKTQYGGPEVHIAIVKIMKHCFNKYFEEVHVIDESGYYETENREHLVDTMKLVSDSLIALEEAFAMHSDDMQKENPSQIVDRVKDILGDALSDIEVISSAKNNDVQNRRE